MASSVDPLSCDAIDPDTITFIPPSLVNQPSSLTPQSSIVSYSSVRHRFSVISPPSFLISQFSVRHRLSVTSPPSLVSPQSLVLHCPSVISPQSSLSSQASVHHGLVLLCPLPVNPTNQLPSHFRKRKFGEARPVFRCFQAAWFKKWPWIRYDQVNDKAFCFTCVKASKQW